jgi:hypothetical protein
MSKEIWHITAVYKNIRPRIKKQILNLITTLKNESHHPKNMIRKNSLPMRHNRSGTTKYANLRETKGF